MNQTMRSRRGVTLAEIMVAVALVAIMITMVVSFALLISERTRNSAQNDAMRQGVEVIRAGAERWLNAVALEGEAITYSDDQTKVTSGAATLEFKHGSLRGVLPDGRSYAMHAEYVTSVTFEPLKNEANGDYLLFCTVTFEDPDTGEPVEFTLCLNSHLGEGGVWEGGGGE